MSNQDTPGWDLGQDETTCDFPRAPHIQCCICLDLIPLTEYRTARCWVDPKGETCAAHAACLIRVGETEIGLR